MTRYTKSKRSSKKKKKKPFLVHVKPNNSDDSFELGQNTPLDCKPLVGCVNQSNLLLPAVVLVPTISGVSCPIYIIISCYNGI